MTETSMRTFDQNIVERVAGVVDAARVLLEGTEHHGDDGIVTVQHRDWNRLWKVMFELRQLVPIWQPIEGGAIVREFFDAGPRVDSIACIPADDLPNRDESQSIGVSYATVESAVRYAVDSGAGFEHQYQRNIAELGARRAIAHLKMTPVMEGEDDDTVGIYSTEPGEPTVWKPCNPVASPTFNAEFAPFSPVEAVIAANVRPGCPISRGVFDGVIGWKIGFGWLAADESKSWRLNELGHFVRKLAAISSDEDETP